MLTNEELLEIHGGFSNGVLVGVASYIISFIIGVFDGYYRPLGC